MYINTKKKKVSTFFFFFIFIFIFLTLNLYSSTLYKTLDRTILSDYNYSTEHFDIYWSFDADYFIDNNLANNNWISKNSDTNLPDFIHNTQDILENLYNEFNNDDLLLPSKIKVYILNTNIKATDPNLTVNSIASLGAFTSDDYPEILINSSISTEYNYKELLKSILVHELTHSYQYKAGILKDEANVELKDQWFTEGLATSSELEYSKADKYISTYFKLLIDNMEYGFSKVDSYIPYTNGFLFYYLIEKYNYNLNNFINRYKLYPTFDKFIYSIENEQNLNKNELVSDIYNSFLYEKSIYGESFENIDVDTTSYNNDTLNIKNGWQLISLPIDTNDFSIFEDIDFTIWGYINHKWSCISSNIDKNKICENNNILLKSISKRDGFWLNSNKNIDINLKVFK
ncbi:MAG: hypothetical protein U9Q30_10505 [Campylobacterota bacterium]|nr:hypothetical protein [Campylobacterota bacterium]